PLGKVAGQRAVGLLDLRYESRRQDLVEAIVGGSWKTQVVRLLFYSIVAFALLYLARALVAAFTNRRISKRGLIADELRSQFDMDDVAEARLAEIALGVYQYTGERNFASFLHSLGHLHPLGAGDEVVAQVDTTAGPVSAQRGSVTRFLKKTNAGRKGVHDLVQRFGLVSEKRVDPRFLDIAERVHDKVGGRSRRPFSGFPRR
ncbi:MAG TPA: hypothetical protein VEA60_08055, partial [Allosphingosinicella sp.]|nr:hypothetical protein [Allosphingosinicella sp.]